MLSQITIYGINDVIENGHHNRPIVMKKELLNPDELKDCADLGVDLYVLRVKDLESNNKITI